MSRVRNIAAVLLLLLSTGPRAPAQEPHVHDEADPTHGGLVLAPEPEMEPEEVGDLAPAVRVVEGDPAGLRVTLEREPLGDFPGLRARVRVRNEGDAAAAIDAVVVADGTAARPWVPPDGLSVLVLQGDGLDRCEVTPLRVRRESRRLLVAARPDRRHACVVGFEAPPPGVAAVVAIEPGLAVTVKLWAEVRYGGRALAAGEELVTPDLLVLFAPEAWLGLSPLLAADAPASREEGSLAPLVPVPRDDGGLALAPHPRGRALDLLEGDGECFVWRTGADEVLLENPGAAPRLVGLRLADVGGSSSEAYELIGPDGPLGLYRGEAPVLVAPSSSLRVTVRSRPERTPDRPAWELVTLAPPELGRPFELERIEGNDPALAERLAHAFRYGGIAIVNHRGTDVLEPLPAALRAFLAPRVVPMFASATRAPDEDEARFLERAANVEWLLGIPRRPPGADAWLVSPEAGWDATPIEGRLADGLPAARGFCVPATPGMVVVVLDLAPADVETLATSLADRQIRSDLYQNIGRAMRTLRAGTPGGVFDELPFERHAPADLAPANPFSVRQWSIQLVPDGRTVLTKPTVDGGTATEDLLLFSRPLVFALDLPTRSGDRVAVALRRAASRTLDDWALEIDGTAIGGVRRTTAPTPDGWIDEVVTFGAKEAGGRPRVALLLRPIGGVMPLARMAFFRVPPVPGVPLGTAPHRTEGPVRRDLDADGHVLRMAGETFLDGFGFRPGGRVEVDLGGRYVSLLARAGIDADAGPGGRAVVRVLVDGEEALSAEVRGGEAPVPLTVPLRGARTVRIQVDAVGEGRDGAPADLVDLVDARLITP